MRSSQTPNHPHGEVQDWLAQAKDGSPEAMGRLLQTCRQYLLLVANQQLPDELRARVGASDLVQQTLLEAQRDFAQFHGGSAEELRAWLHRILANNLANAVRDHQGTAKRDLGRELALAEVPPEQLLARLSLGTDTPGSVALARERADWLRGALARLPERSRQVVHWRNYERRTFREIGERLDCSEEAARKVWSRALRELQEILEPLDDSAGP